MRDIISLLTPELTQENLRKLRTSSLFAGILGVGIILYFALFVPMLILGYEKYKVITVFAVFALSSLLVWLLVIGLAVRRYWESYYTLWLPSWLKSKCKLIGFTLIIHLVVGLVIFHLSALICYSWVFYPFIFGTFGGLEGVVEWTIFNRCFKILQKVPQLKELRLSFTLAFVFFKHLFFWMLTLSTFITVLWIGYWLK